MYHTQKIMIETTEPTHIEAMMEETVACSDYQQMIFVVRFKVSHIILCKLPFRIAAYL